MRQKCMRVGTTGTGTGRARAGHTLHEVAPLGLQLALDGAEIEVGRETERTRTTMHVDDGRRV